MSRLKRLLRAGLTLPRTAWVDLRYNQLGQRWPAPPHTLNLLVNDICNSRCQMCYIWQQKRDDEISPAGLAQTLQDPLFRRLRYIGVSGGEPTLRRDLPDLFRVITEKRPQLRGTGIITNAIRTTDVIERVSQAADICQAAGLPFSLMVSLDGVGDVHDLVRGRPGNFASAMQVIDHFRTRPGIELLFGCTITKDNVWHVDELLDFARQQGLYGRFRVAEFINRLYNEQATTAIRSFSAEEAYHLALFFARLAHTYETNPIYQNTYHSIRGMLLGHKRATKCPYQSHAVVMDCRGQLLYCSPKSPILASTLDQSAERIYLDNIPIRQNILRHHCDDCIHDYHAPPTTRQVWQSARRTSWRLRLRPRPGLLYSQLTPTTHPAHRPVQSALIIGWYGTETAGDKAILGEIIHRLHHEGCRQITVASLNPYLTQWTLRELGYPDVAVIDTYSPALLHAAAHAGATIMGGGPLMDIPDLGHILAAFARARRAGHQTRIAGCGIGPLHSPTSIRAVQRILALSSTIALRDSASVQWAQQATGRDDIINSGDWAVGFVQRWQASRPGASPSPPSPPAPQPTLNCYLREWSTEYKGHLSDAQFTALKAEFEAQLGRWIQALCAEHRLRPRLLAMHHFTIGGDDRDFNRRLARHALAGLDPIVEMRPYSAQDILQSMTEGQLCLAMRFHSVLFAHTLGVPFYAIDYTQGGKIHAFLSDHHQTHRLITPTDLAAGQRVAS